MNIILEGKQMNIDNIYFLEKKNNIIIQGTFTKIIYSNELFSMNGLFFYFPIEVDKIETNMNKTVIRYHPYMKSNLIHIQEIAKIEYDMIDLYKTMTNCHKKKTNILSKQLYSGSLKVYRDLTSNPLPVLGQSGDGSVKIQNPFASRGRTLASGDERLNRSLEPSDSGTHPYIVKISGIWETEDDVGITYKVFHSSNQSILFP
jgi:hypothetical protein